MIFDSFLRNTAAKPVHTILYGALISYLAVFGHPFYCHYAKLVPAPPSQPEYEEAPPAYESMPKCDTPLKKSNDGKKKAVSIKTEPKENLTKNDHRKENIKKDDHRKEPKRVDSNVVDSKKDDSKKDDPKKNVSKKDDPANKKEKKTEGVLSSVTYRLLERQVPSFT